MYGEIKHLRQFGNFRLDTQKKVLWHKGESVPMPLKEIEVLCVLVENHGELVTKDDLLEKVWADSFVEENNLTRHIYLLRKILRDLGVEEDLIQNIALCGYRLTADVHDVDEGEIVLEKRTQTRTLIEIQEETRGNEKLEPVYGSLRLGGSRNRRVAAFTILLVASAGIAAFFGYPYVQSKPAGPGIRSLAVLPLRSFKGKNEDEGLRLRIADALITKLGNLSDISVCPTNSVSRFSLEETDALEAGRELEVDAVLDGRLQTEGEELRVTFQLINVRTGEQLWSGQFDGKSNKILNLQDAIATQILPRLSQAPVLQKNATTSPEAYEAYLRGRYWYHKRNESPDNYQKSLAEFEHALGFDPSYALAYTGLADAHARRANISSGAERIRLYELAKVVALKALALNENLAEAHASVGWLKRIYDWDWQDSEKHLKRAIELAPSNADHHRLYASLLITLGRTAEAVGEAIKARDLDPVAEGSVLAYALMGNSQYDEAIKEYVKAHELKHNPSDTLRGLTLGYLGKGMYAELIELLDQAPEDQKNNFSLQVLLASAYFRHGDKKRAKEMLGDLEAQRKQDPERSVRLACLYGDMGRKDEAIALLKIGLEARDERLLWIKTSPVFESLRDEPQYKEILRKMDLAE